MNNKGAVSLSDLPNVALVFLVTGLLFVSALVILTSFQATTVVGSDCTYTAKTDGGDDYFGVNTASTNSTTMTSDQTFTSYTAFTPRLNITKVVNESFTGGVVDSVYVANWKTPLNVSSSFEIYNGSTLVDASNYTLTVAAGVYTINWTTSDFNSTSLYYKFNRTFIKNVEDLVTNASGIYTTGTTANFLTQAGGGSYGTAKTFLFNGASLGQYLNNTNWAVTWSYTERSCTNYGNTAANTSISKTIDAVAEIPNNWLLLIAVIIAAAIVIGIVISNLGGSNVGRV